ncbi:MAG: peptidase C11, partial [Ruminococcus sp.]|nr:peptidase C11 [Ruminococcus sp.]
AGAESAYVNNETDTVAKSLTELNVGDKLDFICDYYTYDKKYKDSYYFGNTMTVTNDMKISNEHVGDGAVRIMYLITDIYNQQYWSEAIEK